MDEEVVQDGKFEAYLFENTRENLDFMLITMFITSRYYSGLQVFGY